MIFKVFSLVGIIVVSLFLFGYDAKRMWDYEIIWVETYSSDPEKQSLDFNVKQNRLGEVFFDGYIFYNYKLANGTMVEVRAWRSPTGNENEYKTVPYLIPKQTYDKFMKSYYDDLLYKNLCNCSTLPEPENIYPWKNDNYTFSGCIVQPKGFPDIAPQGYYKANFSVTGEVNWGFVGVAKIFDKFMP
ncbi:uncharacterized protein LOC117570306 [Drosophila albomicans]|uniref:Uncharacterized protein LOC117570306 n=1 Tax=Drosophila albomicans TaxID=7291 RepID=A0A9C6STU1_DROAB|nr:uncharacterized protein LOC117570306 [Drosophila albomicans]